MGCGSGVDAITFAQHGAAQVIGIDIREPILRLARRNAGELGLTNTCFTISTGGLKADVVFSVNSFEHFSNPAKVLQTISEMLLPGGRAFISFSPPWLHPFGGHIGFIPLLGSMPWGHVVFPEKFIMWWRSFYRGDGAKHFHEVEGGMNCMTIGHFEKLVEKSPLRFVSFECIPIKHLKYAHSRLTREFLTSTVRCELVGWNA